MPDHEVERGGTGSAGTATPRRVVVIGGGIAGMAAAHRLGTHGQNSKDKVEVLLCEASGRLGGTIHTYEIDDVILELGPDAFITDKPAGLALCRELGIEDKLVSTDQQHRRTFVGFEDSLHPLPEGFMMMAPTELVPLMSSRLLALSGKLRMLLDLITPRMADNADQSLAEFTTRRLGKEAFERVVQPLVGGIFTSDPHKLSVRAALPRIAALEQKYGSIISGMIATRSKRVAEAAESGARYGLFATFDRGMSVLVRALEQQLPRGCVKTHALVSKVVRATDGPRWRILFSDGTAVPADAVILATPSFRGADMMETVDGTLAENLRKIQYSSAAVINLLYKRADIPHKLDGFGFVVPSIERKAVLACSFSSVKWPGRVPQGKALLRVFVGGALNPGDYDLSDEQMECLVWQDLNTYLGIRAVPQISINSRFPKSMPQYNVGHLALMKAIDEGVAALPGLELAGNAYRGVGIPDCIASGQEAAIKTLAEFLTLANPETQTGADLDTKR